MMSIIIKRGTDEMDADRNTTGSSTVSADMSTERSELVDIIEIMSDLYTRINSPYTEQGLKTGFNDLDEMTTGFYPGEYVVIGARPSMGKTAFTLNILECAGIKSMKSVLYFSLSENRNQIGLRMVSLLSGIDVCSLKAHKISGSDRKKLLDITANIGFSNIIIDDTPVLTLTEIDSKCRRVQLERGLDLVIIDYFQLINVEDPGLFGNREQELSYISRSLKALALEYNCPVVVLSQLSRSVEGRRNKRPILSDLRGSGSIEEDADTVLFLYRDEYYHWDSEHKGEAEVIIAKQRSGPTGTVKLSWLPDTGRFMDLRGRRL